MPVACCCQAGQHTPGHGDVGQQPQFKNSWGIKSIKLLGSDSNSWCWAGCPGDLLSCLLGPQLTGTRSSQSSFSVPSPRLCFSILWIIVPKVWMIYIVQDNLQMQKSRLGTGILGQLVVEKKAEPLGRRVLDLFATAWDLCADYTSGSHVAFLSYFSSF